MLADVDGRESNGTAKALTNGSREGQARVPVGTATNGTHKTSPGAVNGSSNNGKAPARDEPTPTYFGHDREEVTRILIQALCDMGYQSAAEIISKDSGYELESNTVSAFRAAILEGDWAQAEQLLSGAVSAGDERQGGNGLVLSENADRNVMRFWIRQQKFLELLEQRDTGRALMVLRTELTPLYQNTQKLHFLSSLLMCQSPDDLRAKAEWDGAQGQSRQVLLSELSKCVSPAVMLPEHRLAVLLEQVKRKQINDCIYHTSPYWPSLYADHLCDRSRFPSEAVLELDKHTGEVWQVLFSHDGTRMASCGSERLVIIWDATTFEVMHKLDAHESGVGTLAWSPDDSMIVTCGSRDQYAKIWKVDTGACIKTLERFEEPVSSCVWAADCRTFITGSFHKEKSLCQWNLEGEKLYTWSRKHRTGDLAVSPDGRWLVAIDDGCHVHVYNFATRELEYEMELTARPTSVSISQDSRYLLVNRTDDQAHLIDIATREHVRKYTGHKGGEFLIRSAFGGADESFVISGSDDGHLCVWHKTSGVLIQKLEAHHPRCNAVSWNPADPCMFASCGDDGKIKIWSNEELRRRLTLNSLQQHSNGMSRSSNGWRNTSNDQSLGA